MSGASITVDGETQLAHSLVKLGDGLEHLEPANHAAAAMLLEEAGPHTPRDSGALAASGRVEADDTGGVVEYDAVYAGVIHNGWPDHNIDAQPWLNDTVTDQRDHLTGVYVDYVEGLVHNVRGA